MNKDDILAKSRKENMDKDLYEKEVFKDGGYIGSISAMILASIFFTIQILVGKGMNYGLYAIVFSIPTAGTIVKAIRTKRTRVILLAVGYSLLLLGISTAHIYGLISTSSIL